jgi:hypothetical protein
VTHPSLPNYLALTAGSTLGCTSNSCEPGYTQTNLFWQLHVRSIGWKVWASSMPEPCARYTTGLYARRHNPAVYFADIYPEPCMRRVIPYPQPLPDRLPPFVFIVPNVCQDMHDCSIATGDAWLSRVIPALRARGAIVVVTFDETADARTRVMTLAIGPGVPAGARDGHRYTHYGVLAGIEGRFGLPLLRNAARARPLPL